MIIYGWSAKNIRQAPLDHYDCPLCGHKQADLVVFVRYVHLFWIPVLPFGKSVVIICRQCRHETDEKSIAQTTGVEAKQLKASVPTPKYLFSGLGLIGLAISFIIYTGIESSRQLDAYIATPQVGDVYAIKSEEEESEFKYYFVKVRSIQGDSLWVSGSAYSYNQVVSRLEPGDGFYKNVSYSVHKASLLEIRKSGLLKKVIRYYTALDGFGRDIEYTEPEPAPVDVD